MTDDDDFAAMFAQTAQGQTKGAAPVKRPKAGDMVTGVVTSIGKDAVFIDLGDKSEGVLDRDQVVAEDGSVRLKVGDKVEARVAGERGGALVLRVRMGRGGEAKAELVQAHELGIPVEGKVTGVIKGGLDVDVAGVRGFCPASQADGRFVADLTTMIGNSYEFRITQYERGNLVLSRRALVEEQNARKAEELRGRLEVGAILRGKVVGFIPVGAFVDITASTFVTGDADTKGLTFRFNQGGAVALASLLYLGLALIMGTVDRLWHPPLWLQTLIFVPATLAAVWFGTEHSTWIVLSWKTWVVPVSYTHLTLPTSDLV